MEIEKDRAPSVVIQAPTGEDILQRYKKIRCDCIKLEGIIMSINAKSPTGSPAEEDTFRAATAVYNGEANISNMYGYFDDSKLSWAPRFHSLSVWNTSALHTPGPSLWPPDRRNRLLSI